jgi:hypothetical protein
MGLGVEFDQDAAGVAEPAAGPLRRGSPESRTFHLLDEFRHLIQGKPRLEITEIAGGDLEGLSLSRDAAARQPAAQRLVDALFGGDVSRSVPWQIS